MVVGWNRAAVALLLASGCDLFGGGHTIVGKVTSGGSGVDGATVLDKLDKTNTVTTDSDGAFEISVETTEADGPHRALIEVNHTDLAPYLAAVKIKEDVSKYQLEIEMVSLEQMDITNGQQMQANLTVQGQPVTISFDGVSGDDLKFRYGIVDAANAPGLMREVGAEPGNALQSGGMLYVDVVDGAGVKVPVPPGMQIQFGGFGAPDIPDADPPKGFRLNDRGNWNDKGDMDGMNGGGDVGVDEFGWWNADRNFRTACVKGKVLAGEGACKGGRLKASGPDGISSHDSSGKDGAFCVMGAQTWESTLTVGSKTQTIQMPANAGNCDSLDTCKDIGTISADADDCAEVEEVEEDEPDEPDEPDGEGYAGPGSFCAYNYPKAACQQVCQAFTQGDCRWSSGTGSGRCGDTRYDMKYDYGYTDNTLGPVGACILKFR